jgi:purine-nucleoside phosphorylase
MGVLGVEMESAALYCTAARAGKRALSICAVSDSLVNDESMTADERERNLTELFSVSLETAIRI